MKKNLTLNLILNIDLLMKIVRKYRKGKNGQFVIKQLKSGLFGVYKKNRLQSDYASTIDDAKMIVLNLSH